MNAIFSMLIIFVIFSIGDIISDRSKAKFSMIFVAGTFFLIAFWLGLPKEIYSKSGLLDFAQITLPMFMAHLGSSIRVRVFISEWKSVVVTVFTTIGLAISVYIIGSIFINKYYALASAPVLAGGMISYLIVKDIGPELLRDEINAFIALILVFQPFVGLPIASFCCKRVAKRFLNKNEIHILEQEPNDSRIERFREKYKLISKKYNSSFIILAKLAFIGCISTILGDITNISSIIYALIISIILSELGILEENALKEANAYTFVLAGALCNIFVSLNDVSPDLFINMLRPLLIIFGAGVLGSILVAVLVGKILKVDIDLAIALASTAFFGFPGTYLISEEIAKAVSSNEIEQNKVKRYIMPKMVLSGIVSMSIVSVMIASIIVTFR